MSFSNLTVMICDDSIFVRKKLKDYISSLGVKAVYEVCDGQEAVDKYMDYKPDVAFMDIVMPRKTGIEAVTEIIQMDPTAKIVMASSVGTQNHLKEALSAGAYEFLQKPISNEQIYKILEIVAKDVK
ncbi:MAG: response regulator [Oscillospiraceae bacterium]|nr:response regulator [Oscillospiraceae bacterium]MBQ8378520.1 response regulator [Oscillospiraceae bacterium]MBQ8883552.1 response regulator [Oscillospiraceae bacterium]